MAHDQHAGWPTPVQVVGELRHTDDCCGGALHQQMGRRLCWLSMVDSQVQCFCVGVLVRPSTGEFFGMLKALMVKA